MKTKTKEEILKSVKTVIGKLKYAQMGTLDGLEFNMNDVIGKSEMMNNCRENIVELEKAEILLSEYATLLAQSSDAVDGKKIIERIRSMKDDSGRSGCTYGDTEYDSLSATYGYNLAIEHICETLIPIFLKEKGGNG